MNVNPPEGNICSEGKQRALAAEAQHQHVSYNWDSLQDHQKAETVQRAVSEFHFLCVDAKQKGHNLPLQKDYLVPLWLPTVCIPKSLFSDGLKRYRNGDEVYRSRGRKRGDYSPRCLLKDSWLCSIEDNETPCVLIMCGSFNPVHNMHCRMLDLAHEVMEISGRRVVASIMSPVHNGYDKPDLIPSKHRVNMCQRALSGMPYAQASDWESTADRPLRTIEVLRQAKAEATLKYKRDVEVHLVCGADLLESMTVPGLWSEVESIVLDFGVVVVRRPGVTIENTLNLPPFCFAKGTIFIAEEVVENNLSSSLIRKMVQLERSIRFLVPRQVREYIEDNHLYLNDEEDFQTHLANEPIELNSALLEDDMLLLQSS